MKPHLDSVVRCHRHQPGEWFVTVEIDNIGGPPPLTLLANTTPLCPKGLPKECRDWPSSTENHDDEEPAIGKMLRLSQLHSKRPKGKVVFH
jgi:hypothetical protein